MTREQFVSFLGQAVRDGVIAAADARMLLTLYDAGDIDPAALPLPTEDAITPIDTSAALALLLLLIGGTAVSRLTDRQREDARERLQDWYQEQADQIAGTEPLENVRGWHLAQRAALLTYLGAMWISAGGVQPERLRRLAQVQQAYLGRFADEAGINAINGTPFASRYVARRAALYGGSGRGLWYQTYETTYRKNVVVDYISEDDKWVCDPCLKAEAQGPYLPGTGPMPGQICEGRDRCRCRRESRVDPVAYQRLRRVFDAKAQRMGL